MQRYGDLLLISYMRSIYINAITSPKVITSFSLQLKLTDIPIDFGPAINENSHLRMADPAGIQMSDLENAITSPEVMTSLQMFQQQRYTTHTICSFQFRCK